MDLDLSSEHQLLRSTIRDFMEKEVAPVIEEHEREHKFLWRSFVGWARAAGSASRSRGRGRGRMDTLAYAIAIEEIGRLGLARADRRRPHVARLRASTSPEQGSRRTATSCRWPAAG